MPLTCEHCGRTGLVRREMEQHKTDECEEILVECEFKVIGCNHAKVGDYNIFPRTIKYVLKQGVHYNEKGELHP